MFTGGVLRKEIVANSFNNKVVVAIILVLLFGGLFAWIYFYEKDKPSKSRMEEDTRFEDISVVEEDPETIARLTIEKDGNKIVFNKKSDELWVFEEPIEEAAEKTKVDEVLGFLTDIKAMREVSGDESDYSLDPHLGKVIMEMNDGRKVEILVGDQNPEMTGYYIKIMGDDKKYLMRTIDYNQIFKDTEYFKKMKEEELTE